MSGIPGRDLLAKIKNDNKDLGIYLERYVLPAIQTTARNAGVSPTAKIAAPQPPESVSVTTAGEMLQVVVNHTAPLQIGAHYITHVATNPEFINSQIIDHGPSRAPAHIVLPTKNLAGDNHQFYVATVVQYPGSPPSKPTYYGGKTPIPITLSGSTQMDIQQGTGSGTARNGGQVLVGLGKASVRLGSK